MLTSQAFDLLELHEGASRDEIKSAYRRMAKMCHPDVASPHLRQEAEIKFKQISEAYNYLLGGNHSTRNYARASHYSNSHPFASHNFVRRGSKAHYSIAGLPFILLVGATLSFGGARIASAYRKSQEESVSYHPFLP